MSKPRANVYHFDLYGKRHEKYEFLSENTLKSIAWNELNPEEPNFFFVKKDFDTSGAYEKGFKVDELFPINTSGIKTHDDNNLVSFKIFEENNFPYDYRPFDVRNICYDLKKVIRHRYSVMKHLLHQNIALTTCRQQSTFDFQHIFISKYLIDMCTVSMQTKETTYAFPLYLYPEAGAQQTLGQITTPAPPKEGNRTPNLNMEIVKKIAEGLGLKFVPEKNSPPSEGCPTGGVVISSEGCPTGGVVISSEGCPTGGVVISSEGCPTGEVVISATDSEVVTTIENTRIIRNFVRNLPYNPALNQLAKEKRKAGILSEVLFWQQVHKGKFHTIDFDRQRIIGNYIVDFYVKTLGLVVEIDGSSHDNKADYDAERQFYLENLGLKVYRIADFDVKKNIVGVMIGLENFIVQEYGERTTPPVGHPSEGGKLNTLHSSEGGELNTRHSSEGGELNTRHSSEGGEFAPIDILDYIYAVLHSPAYREKYKEFLKIDFPRVPYPCRDARPYPCRDARPCVSTFWQLVKLGGELRQIHLLESPVVENYITQYPIDGNNKILKIKYLTLKDPQGFENPEGLRRVYINDTQYFDNVPETAWNFYIGGYQPAQKWLKDRKDRTLEFEDILHYQKIIVALSETDRLMKEIDKIGVK